MRAAIFTILAAALAFVLLAMLFPGIIKECGPAPPGKHQASQIVVALRAYYLEYGSWPVSSSANGSGKDPWFGEMKLGASAHNNALFFPLRNIAKGPNENLKANLRGVVFFEGQNVTFRKGIPSNGFYDRGPNGAPPSPELEGCYFDPWGNQYGIVIDTNDDGRLDLRGIYSDFTGDHAPRTNVGVFSLGKDGTLGANGDRFYRKGNKVSDDIVSWE